VLKLKLAQLRQTGAPVAEDDHTLVLGFGTRTLRRDGVDLTL